MPAYIAPIITDAGLSAAVSAKASGFALEITHIALGTGKYTADLASVAGMTAMAARKESVMPGVGVVSGAGGFMLATRFAAWTGSPSSYEATEIGFFAGDPAAGGVLFAVYSHPTDVIVVRNSLDYIGSFLLQLTRVPVGSVSITLDPDAAEWMALLQLHLTHSDPHTQYLKKSGGVSTGPQLGVTAPQHDSSKTFATTEFVNRVGINFPPIGALGIYEYPFTATLAMVGRWLEIGEVPTVPLPVVNLPKASTVPVGASFQFRVLSRLAVVRGFAGDTLFAVGPYNGLNELMFSEGETFTMTRNSDTSWYVTNIGFKMPAGSIGHFPSSVAPPGWLKMNGALVSRALYPGLWRYAQNNGVVSDAVWMNNSYWGRFSAGVSGNDFRLPDARGVFIRNSDDGRGFDPGRDWGTFQDHANRAHTHSVQLIREKFVSGSNAGFGDEMQDGTSYFSTDVEGGPDGHPRNLNYLACVKF